MRIYDPRLGRFLSVDPISMRYPELTPYQFANDAPTASIDIDSLERDKAFNGNEELKQGIGWLIKNKANEISILFKAIIISNPYTSLAIKATRGVSENLVRHHAIILHKNAAEVGTAYKALLDQYHNLQLYSLEYGAYSSNQRFVGDHNNVIDEYDYIKPLEDLQIKAYFVHEAETHSNTVTERTSIGNFEVTGLLNKTELEATRRVIDNLNSKIASYEAQKLKVVHYQYIVNFRSEFTPQAIATDIVSYFNDILNGPTKVDGLMIDEINDWLNPNSSSEKKQAAADRLIEHYIYRSSSEISHHIRILGLSNLTTDNLIENK